MKSDRIPMQNEGGDAPALPWACAWHAFKARLIQRQGEAEDGARPRRGRLADGATDRSGG